MKFPVTFGPVVVLLLLPVSPASATDLYAVTGTDTNNVVEFGTLSTNDGSFVPVFDFTLPENFTAGTMTYDHASDLFLMLSFNVGTSESNLVLIDTNTQQVTSVAITGLPEGQLKTSGIGYHSADKQILITFGQTGTFAERRFAEIDSNGIVQQTTDELFGDRDTLAYDDFSQRLLACDLNKGDPNRINRVDDLFGNPVITLIGSPPSNNDAGDVAIDPESGSIFVTGFAPPNGQLLRLNTELTDYEIIGTYQRQLVGIAFDFDSVLLGDVNLDGVVDFLDIQPFVDLLNMPGAYQVEADINEDGVVDFLDIEPFVELLS